MADENNTTAELATANINGIEMAREMRTSFLEYAMSVIVARALPDVRDGLKPVHRRILFAMHETGITPSKPHKKSAWTVGEVIGKYHPHGDVAVYDTMVRMAQDFSMRLPLIDGHGNFGSVDGDAPAAMRYTESRLARPAMELLRDLEKDTVEHMPNYDESLQEPAVLPARYPNLLVNGSQGIAVGMATNIPPHNLGEVIDATCALIDNPEITIDEIIKIIPGPDFPTGAKIMGRSGIVSAYNTGKGRVIMRAVTEVEERKSGKESLIIKQIPYGVNKARLVDKIDELRKEGKITEISAVRDESGRDGMRAVVELKSGAIAQVVLNKLFKHTQLQETFGIITLALVDGVPRTLNIKECLQHYIAHQEEVITRRTKFDLAKAEARAHILQGLVIALDHIDEVIKIIRGSKTDVEAKTALIAKFSLSEVQTDAILEMRLRRLVGLEREKVENELKETLEQIAYYNKVLGSQAEIHRIIKEELTEIRQRFATPRRTVIENATDDLEVEDFIAEEDMVVTVTQGGYVKRLSVDTYRSQKRGGRGLQGVNLKDEDFVEHLFVANTHAYMLFFSTKGKVYKLKVHELPVGSRTARGSAIVNLLPFEEGETIATVMSTKDFPSDEYLLFATAKGSVKKTAMDAYASTRSNGLIAIKLNDDDALIAVRRVKGDEHVVLAASNGKAIVFNNSEARPMGRGAAGVRGMRLTGADVIVGCEIAESEEQQLLVLTANGYGKRTPFTEYRSSHRGGSGIKTLNVTPEKGPLAAMKVVSVGQDLIIISQEGVLIRLKAEDIKSSGRATQGVRVMKMGATDKVSTLAVASDEDADEDKPASDAAASTPPAAETAELELDSDSAVESNENELEADTGSDSDDAAKVLELADQLIDENADE